MSKTKARDTRLLESRGQDFTHFWLAASVYPCCRGTLFYISEDAVLSRSRSVSVALGVRRDIVIAAIENVSYSGQRPNSL